MKRSREPEEDCGPSSTIEQDVAVVPVSKIVGLDVDDSQSTFISDFTCSLPGHGPGLRFATYEEYESHYHKAHENRCIDCRKNFPSSHMLNLHIREFHDALAELQKEKGDSIVSSCFSMHYYIEILMVTEYSCFVETCAERRKTPAERRAHLIETHKYPTNYFFAVTKAGVDRRQSMLVHRNEGKPRTNQRDNTHHQGHKDGKKRTGKDTTPGTAKGGDVQKNVATDDGAAEPVDVAMSQSDNQVSQDQLSDDYTSKGHITGNTKGSDIASLGGITDTLSGRQAVQDRKAAAQDTDMEQLAGAMSSLKFVPRNVRLSSKKSGLPLR